MRAANPKPGRRTRKTTDFNLAYRLLTFADSVHPSRQAKFLAGISALGFAQAAFSETTSIKEKDKSCELALAGAAMVPAARADIVAGQEEFAEPASQAMGFVAQLETYMKQQMPLFCTKVP